MISISKLKNRIAGISVFGIIINKFCHKKKLYLIILFQIDNSLKKGFYYIILLFSLTICLWIEGCKKFSLDVKEIV